MSRVPIVNGEFQLQGFFKLQLRFFGDQRSLAGSTRQGLQAFSLLSETLNESDFRQIRQCLESVDSPGTKGFLKLGRKVKNGNREEAQGVPVPNWVAPQ